MTKRYILTFEEFQKFCDAIYVSFLDGKKRLSCLKRYNADCDESVCPRFKGKELEKTINDGMREFTMGFGYKKGCE